MTKLAMLNAMASEDFVESLAIQKSWGIDELDLKDHIFGKSITDLSDSEARLAAELIQTKGLSVYCFSTQLFHDHVEKGEAYFSEMYASKISRTIEIARILNPTYIRILPVKMEQGKVGAYIHDLSKQYRWLIDVYRHAIDQFSDAGFRVTIENENDSILASPGEILEFFDVINRNGKLFFTYDVQNLWQMGTYPSIDVYSMLKPILVYFHVKGGIEDRITKTLKWKSSLDDATWPVESMVKAVIADELSPVICLNPSHGELNPTYNYERLVQRDLSYMNNLIDLSRTNI
jgi:hypothetical protein